MRTTVGGAGFQRRNQVSVKFEKSAGRLSGDVESTVRFITLELRAVSKLIGLDRDARD